MALKSDAWPDRCPKFLQNTGRNAPQGPRRWAPRVGGGQKSAPTEKRACPHHAPQATEVLPAGSRHWVALENRNPPDRWTSRLDRHRIPGQALLTVHHCRRHKSGGLVARLRKDSARLEPAIHCAKPVQSGSMFVDTGPLASWCARESQRHRAAGHLKTTPSEPRAVMWARSGRSPHPHSGVPSDQQQMGPLGSPPQATSDISHSHFAVRFKCLPAGCPAAYGPGDSGHCHLLGLTQIKSGVVAWSRQGHRGIDPGPVMLTRLPP